jgi:hypothetical protein
MTKIVKPFIATKDPLVRDLLHRFSKRSDDGITAYKCTMDRATKPLQAWITDAQEEAWDKIVYLEKLKKEVVVLGKLYEQVLEENNYLKSRKKKTK